MADNEVTEEVAPKKSGSSLMIVLIVLIVLLIGAVGAIGYFMYSKGMLEDNPEAAKAAKEAESKKEADAQSGGETFNAAVENLVLNITNAKGREKLMKLSFSIKSIEATIATLVENNKAEIQDAVIAQISARTSEELLTAGGKALLKEEMLTKINMIINESVASNEDIKQNSVKKLFFTTFVIK